MQSRKKTFHNATTSDPDANYKQFIILIVQLASKFSNIQILLSEML